jgi:hypothetical protein
MVHHNKADLNKEILEKVKEGIKPSDLKKNKNIPTPPPPPSLPKSKEISGLNQQTFNGLIRAGLTEGEIKQKIGDLSVP